MVAAMLAAALTFASLLALHTGDGLAPDLSGGSSSAGAQTAHVQPSLAQLASTHPNRQVEVIIQLRRGAGPSAGDALVSSAGGTAIRHLPIINGLGARMTAAQAERMSTDPAVQALSLNAPIKGQGNVHRLRHRHNATGGRAHHRHGAGGRHNRAAPTTAGGIDTSKLSTSYPLSIRADKAWASGYTGKGVGVAVVDTGIAGKLADFQVSRSDSTSRVIASAVVNPGATKAGDSFGHGTHIAGLIAGNGTNRAAADPLSGKYVGVAPDANLIDVKVADENGEATVLDVIDGLQFAVDHKSDYNIRVVNLSLKSTSAESYRTDPLDAAAEATWNSGIVVVAAAGNMGADSDSVSFAPANDPYVITVGAVDDQGNKGSGNDLMSSWSSRGASQDGYVKPDVLAPGAHLVSTIPPGSAYTQLCPSCVTDGAYFKVGGTSMAAALVSGEVADALQANPSWSPNQVKAQVVNRSRPIKNWSAQLVDGSGTVQNNGDADVIGGEASLDKVLNTPITTVANAGLASNNLIDPATGQIDYSRASWSRASWSDAIDPLRASWSRASWSRASWSRASWSATPQTCTDLERASWSRASWSRASWSRASWSGDGLTAEQLATIDAQIAAAKQECSELLAKTDPTRASWSRASWSRASWSTSFDK
jgi:serine protease AprX